MGLVFNVSVMELEGTSLRLVSSWHKLFTNQEAAEKYSNFVFESEGYSEIKKEVSNQNGGFTLEVFTGSRKEVLESKMIIEILAEEPAETFEP